MSQAETEPVVEKPESVKRFLVRTTAGICWVCDRHATLAEPLWVDPDNKRWCDRHASYLRQMECHDCGEEFLGNPDRDLCPNCYSISVYYDPTPLI